MTEEQKTEQEAPKTNEVKSDVKGMISQLEAILDEYMIKKAPFALPIGIKEFIVTASPYLIIIFAVLALPAILISLGLSTFFAPFAMMGGLVYGNGWGFGVIVSVAVSIAVIVIEIMAVPGLFKRTKSSWRLLFYASIMSLIGSIISITGIVGGIIGAIIGWYILFQVKELYKN